MESSSSWIGEMVLGFFILLNEADKNTWFVPLNLLHSVATSHIFSVKIFAKHHQVACQVWVQICEVLHYRFFYKIKIRFLNKIFDQTTNFCTQQFF